MKAAPELFAEMDGEELCALGQKIRAWQNAKGKSDAEMCRTFAELGSDKTYRKVREGELAGLDLETQLNNYRTAWALVEGTHSTERGGDEIYPDISATLLLTRVFAETRRENGLGRCILMFGPTSSGKTDAQRYLQAKHGPRIVAIRANPAAVA